MSSREDPQFDTLAGQLLEHIVVPPSAGFWDSIDESLAAEAAKVNAVPGAAPTPRRGVRRWEWLHWISAPALVAAGIAVLALGFGLLAIRDTNSRIDVADESEVFEGDEPSAVTVPVDGADVTTTDSTTRATDTKAVPAQLTVETDSLGGFSGFLVQTADGDRLVPTTHMVDVDAQPLSSNVVSDGSGGFVYAITDFDDSLPVRSSRLLHVAAGTARPVVIATEPEDGIGFIAGIVDSPDGARVVYVPLLSTETRSVPLAGGDPVTISPSPAVGAGGQFIVTVDEVGCGTFVLADATGAVAEGFNLTSQPPCASGIDIQMSSDGTRLSWIAGNTFVVVEIPTGQDVYSAPLADGSNILVAFDGETALVNRGDADGPRPSVVVTPDGGVIEAGPGLAGLSWPAYDLSPDLVLGL